MNETRQRTKSFELMEEDECMRWAQIVEVNSKGSREKKN